MHRMYITLPTQRNCTLCKSPPPLGLLRSCFVFRAQACNKIDNRIYAGESGLFIIVCHAGNEGDEIPRATHLPHTSPRRFDLWACFMHGGFKLCEVGYPGLRRLPLVGTVTYKLLEMRKICQLLRNLVSPPTEYSQHVYTFVMDVLMAAKVLISV
ncbi:hypothetical protein EDC04DRAFT_2638627 [Pisolithus marmoratus]|nr:hypothetical protein EDC04DRAFT_2638627 [Pisolithus marmoratus]